MLLTPSLQRARELARQAVCAANFRGVGAHVALYANDWSEYPTPHGHPGYTTEAYLITAHEQPADYWYRSGAAAYWVGSLTLERTWYDNDMFRCPGAPARLGNGNWGYGPDRPCWQTRALPTTGNGVFYSSPRGVLSGTNDVSKGAWYVFMNPLTYRNWCYFAFGNGCNRMAALCYPMDNWSEWTVRPGDPLAIPGPRYRDKLIRAQACCPVLCVMNPTGTSWDCYEPHGDRAFTGTYQQGVDTAMPEDKNYLFTDGHVEFLHDD